MTAHPPTRSPAPRWAEHTVAPDEAGRTVEDILTGSLRISRRMIQKLTRSKGIRLNRKAAFLARKVKSGDVVGARVTTEEEVGLEPWATKLAILHEDRDILLLNKPPFLLVHPLSPEHRETLAHGIAHHYLQQDLRTKVRPVHRLDRDTSGVLLIAKTAVAHQRLDRQLRERTMKREYLALVDGVVTEESGVIDAPIGRDRRRPHLRTVRTDGGDAALTRYQVVERYDVATLVRLELETGRTHQIRVHMMHRGHPLLGDRQYGRKGLSLMSRQALHASRLAFLHPNTDEPLSFEAPLPADMAELRDTLRQPRVS